MSESDKEWIIELVKACPVVAIVALVCIVAMKTMGVA